MVDKMERRKEQRLRYHWPVWFAEDFDRELIQGQLVDVSSNGVAFTCHDDGSCPNPGQEITARFSVPRFGGSDSFDMACFTRRGNVRRVEQVNSYLRRVAIRFAESLPFKPGEQAENDFETQQRLKAVTI